jgi:Xaa-Pro aminopeptidase
VGHPDKKQSEMHQLVVNVLEKVTGAVRPGIKPSELVAIYRREFENRGFPEHSATSFTERGYRTR